VHIPKDERRKLDSNPRNVSSWDMEPPQKVIDCMIQLRRRLSSAEMSFLMNRNVDLKK